MTNAYGGALLGLMASSGVWLLVVAVVGRRQRFFEARVLAHLADMPQLSRPDLDRSAGPFRQLFGPWLASAARALERVLGGSVSIKRRLDRAALDLTVAEFRGEQVTWGLAAFAVAGSVAVLGAMRSPDRALPLTVMALLVALAGVMLRENRLTAQVNAHEREVLAELPAVAELLALSVAAGEGIVAALERVVGRSHGALAGELARVLAEVRTGAPLVTALDDYAARTGLPVVSRFASGIAVAVERGTPMADVLHAQAADVREAQRRALIESGARREVAMMLPVVFLVLPTTVLFAFWPGVVGLRLVTP